MSIGFGRHGWAERLALASVRAPKRTMLAWALISVVTSLGAVRLQIDTATSSFLDRSGPAWQSYQLSTSLFGGDEFIVVSVKGDEPFDSKALGVVRELSQRFQDIEQVRRVDSISTVSLIVRGEGGLVDLSPALRVDDPSGKGLDQIASKVRSDPMVLGSLVSRDERAFAINVFLDRNVDAGRDRVVREIEKITKNLGVDVSGVPVFRTRVNTRTGLELAIFVPLTLVIVGLLIHFAFGAARAAALALGAAGIGTWVPVGAMGGSGIPISLSTSVLPPIMLALGCAYVVHILAAVNGLSKGAGLEEALARISRPVALSGITTAIGFLAMSTVPIGAIRELSSFGALGVMTVLGAALTIVPAMLTLFPLGHGRTARQSRTIQALGERLVGLCRGRAGQVAAISLSVGLVFGIGVSHLHVNTDIIRWFPEGSEIRDSYETIREQFAGITPVNVIVQATEGRVVTEPLVLDAIDELAAFVAGLPEVGRTLSLVDPLRQVRRVFEGSEKGSLPDSRALTEQYLAVLGSVQQVQDLVSDDRRYANLMIRADANSSAELMGLGRKIEEWWGEYGAQDFSATVTGIMYEFGRAEEAIALGQARGFGLAFLVVGMVLLLTFSSPRTSFLALVPNALPMVIVFGCMGYWGVPLDAATVCVASIALGIAVDDTIHIAVNYREEIARGRGQEGALREVMKRALLPMLLTTVAIGSGFLVLGLSEFTLIRHFGVMTSCIVVLCLVADLTLLPVLLKWSVRVRSDGVDPAGPRIR